MWLHFSAYSLSVMECSNWNGAIINGSLSKVHFTLPYSAYNIKGHKYNLKIINEIIIGMVTESHAAPLPVIRCSPEFYPWSLLSFIMMSVHFFLLVSALFMQMTFFTLGLSILIYTTDCINQFTIGSFPFKSTQNKVDTF